tara:strand:+ start:187 stop:975 length:789 start_codon:yes stop_codon:yes gene_type:complete
VFQKGLAAFLLLLFACATDTPEHETHTPSSSLVQKAPFTKLIIHAAFAPGMEPPETMIEVVEDSIQALIQKPEGVSVERFEELDPAQPKEEWALEELDQLVDQVSASTPQDTSTQHVYVLFLDGTLTEPSRAGGTRLGFAWGSDRIVIFRQAILDLCQSLTFSTEEEQKRKKACQIAGTEVWIHELGHLLGLVDNGLPMQVDHKDPDHGHHDMDPACVMYWAKDKELLIDEVKSRIEAGKDDSAWFCDHCQEDVLAAQQTED